MSTVGGGGSSTLQVTSLQWPQAGQKEQLLSLRGEKPNQLQFPKSEHRDQAEGRSQTDRQAQYGKTLPGSTPSQACGKETLRAAGRTGRRRMSSTCGQDAFTQPSGEQGARSN